jgi:hypothetical protein
MKDKTTILDLANGFMQKASENFRRDGHLIPIAIVFTSSGCALLACDPSDRDWKDRLTTAVRVVSRASSALAVMYLTESWSATGNEAHEWARAHNGTISGFPGKKEVLSAMLEFADSVHATCFRT